MKRHSDQDYNSQNIKKNRSDYKQQSSNNRSNNKNHGFRFNKNHVSLSNGVDSKETYNQISSAITHYCKDHAQTYECFQRKQQLRDALYAIMQDIVPYIGVYIIGSSANGFGTNKSDVDMCLMVSDEEIDQKTEAVIFLKLLSKGLRKAEFIRHLQVIQAKVPIIKFHDAFNRIDCDLNVNSHNGIRNTHLMKYYSEIEWRVKPLVLTVKRWAKFHDINDAAKQTISSYSLALMTIFYLQAACKPAVVPVLHDLYPDMFHVNSDVRSLDLNVKLNEWKSNNEQSLGELFTGFLRYYSEFDYRNNVICVRTGKLVPVRNYMYKNDDGAHSQWKHLCIEEPFDLTNTARSVYDYYVFQRIIRIFRKSHQLLAQTKNLDDLFHTPFIED